MRLNYVLLLAVFCSFLAKSQNFTVSNMDNPKCYGDCDGTITLTTSLVTGTFTAVLTNTGSCPNSTVQNSTINSITINSICGCPSPYTITIYNPAMAVVGTMVQQFINYSTGPLSITTNTMTQATCSNCCDGDVTFSVTGGSQQAAPTYSVDGTFTNNINPLYFLCVGNHTVCIKDASGCVACTTLNMSYQGAPTGIPEQTEDPGATLYPNPATNEIFISASNNQSILRTEVYTVEGKKVISQVYVPEAGKAVEMKLDGLSSGLYYITVYNQYNQAILRRKFVKSTH